MNSSRNRTTAAALQLRSVFSLQLGDVNRIVYGSPSAGLGESVTSNENVVPRRVSYAVPPAFASA